MTPIEAIPTPDLAVPYAAPKPFEWFVKDLFCFCGRRGKSLGGGRREWGEGGWMRVLDGDARRSGLKREREEEKKGKEESRGRDRFRRVEKLQSHTLCAPLFPSVASALSHASRLLLTESDLERAERGRRRKGASEREREGEKEERELEEDIQPSSSHRINEEGRKRGEKATRTAEDERRRRSDEPEEGRDRISGPRCDHGERAFSLRGVRKTERGKSLREEKSKKERKRECEGEREERERERESKKRGRRRPFLSARWLFHLLEGHSAKPSSCSLAPRPLPFRHDEMREGLSYLNRER